jgi:flagellar biosynthesis/type III secretory pathway protein FliH
LPAEARNLYKVLSGKEAESTTKFTLATFGEVADAAEAKKKKSERVFKADHPEKADHPQKKSAEFVLGGFDFEYGGGYRSDEIMKKTFDEADAIIADAKNKATGIERDAFHKGLVEGRQQGKAESSEEVSSLIGALKGSIAKLTGARDEFYTKSEHEMVDLVVLIASEIVVREIRQDKNIIADVIRKAVAELHTKQSVSIKLNKADMEIAQSIRQNLMDELESIENVDFTADNSITPGGCLIKTDIGMVDATVEGRLYDLHRTLKEHLE